MSSKNLRNWRQALCGEPAFLIGNGPSASDENLSIVKHYMTIGLNRAFLLFDPVVLFWQDGELFERHREIKTLKAHKVCRNIADPVGRFINYRLASSEKFGLADSPHVLRGKGATGPLAVQFANALGCSPIILIGFDCKYRDGKTDFYGVNPSHSDKTLPNCIRGLQWIASLGQRCPIINCSDNDVLPNRQKLQDVLNVLKPPLGREVYSERLEFLLKM